MGGLSSGPGPGICFLALCLLFLAQQSQSAPVQEDNLSQQSRAQGYYDGSSSELSSGCYYNFQHYGEGDRIITNEPCLNCTCRNRMLMCYLRVCPFTKAIGQNCTIEKKPGQCCPLIICPEVPVQLLTSSTTTEHSESMSHKTQLGYGHHGTGVGHLDDYGCRINGEFYTNGAQIPGNIDKPCEVCYCIRNRTACIMQECTLQVDGCIPVYEEGLCCPVRYQCDYDYSYNAITTEEPRPTPGLVLTTTSGPFECQHDGKWYADGSSVDTEDPCEHCYCMKGDIVCAVQECKPPFEKDGHNCTAMPPAPGKCCPDSYHCDGNEIVAASETTFRQDRMHKFGRNNANVTMSITSSTSSSDKHHGWNYGTNANEKEPNRFTDEQNKDGTTDEDGHMMITEGIPPTLGPLESGSHHLEGHYEGKPVSEGHGVNTDNMLTISQVIQSIVHNQTQLLNQNRLNQSMAEKPVHDDKIHFPVDHIDDGKRPHHTDEDGNPLESHSTATEFPEEYYGFTGGSSDIYAEHSGRPQTRPTKPGKPGQAIFGEHGHFGRPIKRPVTSGEHAGTTDLPKGYTGQPGKRPITHKVPGTDGTSVMTDEMGNPIEGVTGLPEGFTGKPGTMVIYYDEHGRPHKRPIGSKPEGVTEVYEGVTDGEGVGTYVYYDEHGRPHTRPAGHKQPGDSTTNDETSTGISEGFTGKPGTQTGIFGEHGHSGRPTMQKHPGMADEMGATGVYDESTGQGFTGKPGVHGQDGEGVTGRPDGYTGVYKKPGVHTQTGMDDGVTEVYEGMTETIYGRPQKRPGMTEGVTNKDGTLMEGVTKAPGHFDSTDMFGEHGRPHKKPTSGPEGVKVTTDEDGNVIEETTETGHTGTPDGDGSYGRPKPGVHKKPGQVMTDENGNPIEAVTGQPEYHTGRPDSDGMEIVYDKYGRPHRRPVHKKPGMDGEVTTAEYEGATDTPGHTETPDFVIMYDNHGRPIKMPVHKTPGMQTEYMPTDKDGKPVEGVTESTEAHTGMPDYVIFYDQFGRPHKMPVGHKRPQVVTDANGKPVEGQDGVTETPEGFTGTPEDNEYTIVYDGHGRPIKRPIHMRPGMDGEYSSTDKYGKPVTGVTEIPDSDDSETYYDEHGRPIKPTTAHKKPGMHDEEEMTGEHTGTTETAEGQTATPQFMIVYDKHGRPVKKPIRRPGFQTDKYGKPVEGTTETPEGHTGTPGSDDDEVYYDKYGNPIKVTGVHKTPSEDTMTDEEGTTETAEGHTGKPVYMIVYDKQGRPVKLPIRRPGFQTDKYGKPVGETTETPEGHTGTPGSDDDEVYYDKYGNPIQVTGLDMKPGMHGEDTMTDEDGKPLEGHEGTTETAEGHTGTPVYMIVYDKHGRPVKKPIRRPGFQTDKYGKPVEGTIEMPEGHTGTPGSDDEEVYYDKHGNPVKVTGVHMTPSEDTMTDEDGKPLEGHEGTTETPEGHTRKPVFMIAYDKHGRPVKVPIPKRPGMQGEHQTTDKYGKPVEGTTETAEGHTGTPSTEDYEVYYDKYGNPVKVTGVQLTPSEDTMTDEDGKPLEGHEGTTETAEGHTGTPQFMILYDKQGRPVKIPMRKRPGMQGEHQPTDKYGKPVEGTTEIAEGHTGTPGSDDGEVYYDVHGNPVKVTGVHMTSSEDTMTDEDGKPLGEHEGTTETPEGHTRKPVFMIAYDKHGRPVKVPIQKRPGMQGEHQPTDKYGKPVEGTTETVEGHTGTPGSDDDEVYYDKYGNPVKVTGVHMTPSEDTMTDEDGKPLEGHEGTTETAEGHTGTPQFMIVYDKNGRPVKKPIRRPGFQTDKYGKPVEGTTEMPEGHTGTPGSDDDEVYFDKHGNPVKVTGVHMTPSEDTMTDEEGTTETAEGHTGKPVYMIVYDKHGRPVKVPMRKRPGMQGEHQPTDEYGKPVEGMTETPEGHTGTPENDGETVYDQHGRPIKRPVYTKPGMHDDQTDKYGKPVEGVTETPDGRPYKKPGTPGPDGVEVTTDEDGNVIGGMTETPDVHYDEHGRPKPGVHKRPGTEQTTDEHGKPLEDHETESADGHTDKPVSFVTFFDQYGRPHRRPVYKKPGSVLTDDEGNPLDEVSGTDRPGLYGEHGRPHQRPGMTGEDDQTEEYESSTGTPDDFTGKPGTHAEPEIYGEHGHTGRPHKRPVSNKKPGMQTSGPMDEETEEHQTGRPGVYYDEHGRPYKKPVTSEYGDQTTELPEGHTGRPESDGTVPGIFGEHGRPHKRPVVHKKPGEDVMTDEDGNPIDGVTYQPDDDLGSTERPDGQTLYGKPRPGMQPGMTDEDGSTEVPHGVTGTTHDGVHPLFGEDGRPHKKPVTRPQGQHDTTEEDGVYGTTETPDGYTGHPLFGEHGHTGRPVGQKHPATHGASSTETPEEISGTQIPEIYYDEHGKPIKPAYVHTEPSTHGEDEMTGEHTGTTETAEGHTGTPQFMIVYDKHGRPVKKPIRRPGYQTDKYGKPVEGTTETPEGHTGTPGSDDEEVYYDKHGNPVKVTGVHMKPSEDTMTDEDGKPLGEHEGTTETAEGHTGTPVYMTVYDKHGRPVKIPIRKRPGMQGEHQPTDKDGKPIEGTTETAEGHTGTPSSDDDEVYYDKHGNPVKVTGVHMTPSEDTMTDEEGTTETAEGHTGKPVYMIVYDKHGRPVKVPMRNRPGMQGEHQPTDEYGKPVEGMTETPEGHTGTPENDGETVYDQHGRPIKRPVYTKPGMHDDQTDKYGKPVEGMTESPEGHTSTPEVYYDKHGKPIKPTSVHTGMDDEHTPTDEYGKPVYGMTETPEGHTGTPESDEETVYDKHGRPIKRPVHKPTDGYSQPVEGMTETPGQTETPDFVIMYDNHGRPIKMPVHKTPGGIQTEYMPTDKDGKPSEGVSDDHTGTTDDDYVVFYDQFGRPHKVPVGHKKPVLTDDTGKPLGEVGTTGKPESDDMTTDEHGRPVKPTTTHKKPGMQDEDEMTEEHTGTTETAEGQTTTPEFMIVYDKHGRPIKKPIRKKPGMQGEHEPVEGTTETAEGHTGTPDSDDETVYDQHGRPIKHPVYTKPTMHDETPTDKYGKPVEGATETPEGHTGTPELVYDQFGRPIKRPVYTKPDMDDATTDKYGEDESPESQTGKPSETPEIFGEHGHTGRPHKKPIHSTPGPDGVEVTTDENGNVIGGMTETPDVHYDEHGRPKPTTHEKPGMDDNESSTDGKPLEEHEGTTETAEGHTGTPEFMIVYDQHGRPIKKPIRKKPGMQGEHQPTDKYGKPVEGTTETPEGHTGTPDSDSKPTGDHAKPGMDDDHAPTDKYGKPGMTETPETQTGTPSSDDKQPVFDEHGQPIKPTIVYQKPGTHEDDMTGEHTETPEGHTQTPLFTIVYDERGRPVKKPIRKKPGMQGEHEPVEGTTETAEGHTGAPDSDGETVHDHQPTKRPVYTKPTTHDQTPTDKYGKPVEGSTETPEGHTGTPDADEPVYDQFGRPVKRPIHSKPGMDDATTDNYGKPADESPESQTGKPSETPEIFGEHGHTGRPHKKPIHGTPGPDGVEVTTDEDGNVLGGMTETPESHTVHYDEHGRPKPGVMTDDGKPMTETPGHVTHHPEMKPTDEHGHPMEEEGVTRKPGVVYDEHGRPQDKPDDEHDEHGHPTYEVVTMVTEEHTGKPESDSHHVMPDDHDHTKPHDDVIGSTSRPHETTVVQKKPDDTMTPEEGMGTPEDHTGRPGSDSEPTIYGEHGHTGRPHTRPVKPGTVGSHDATETPEGDHTTGSPVTFDEEGRPVGQKRPGHEGQPQGPHGDDQEPHKGPQEVEQHPTDVHSSTPVTSQEGLEPHSKPEDADEGTESPVHKKPEMEGDHATESPEYGSTGKPTPSGVETYFDEFGRPHHRPTSTDESDVHNEVPEGFTGKPDSDQPGLFGEPGHTGRPHKRPVTDDETPTTESFTDGSVVHYDEQGRPIKKPVTTDDVAATEGPDGSSVVTEPQLFGEHGRPHKKPVLKPGTDHTEEGSTHKPDHDSPITLFGESGRPTKKPTKPVEHDEERPEENEISEGDKATEVPTGEHEGTKVAEPTQGTHPEGVSTPEGIWQYLPPKETISHEEPEGATHDKPGVQTTEGLTAPEEDDGDEDDSLIITTDEPEEETEDDHGPTDTKTKLPGESVKPQDEVQPSTPGLGSHSHDDFTTPGYGTHDSSLPVTDGAVHGHPSTQGVDEQPDLSHLGPDGVSFPGANVVFDKDGHPHIIPGQHSEYVPGHPGVPVTTPGLEDEVPAEGDETSHDTERPETVTGQSTPEDGSTPGVTIVFDKDGKPQIVHESSSPDVKGKPEEPTTTEKKPSHGQFPGIPAGFLPSFSETGAPNTDAPIMIDGGLNEGSPFDAVLDSLANVLRPMHTTEKAAETTEPHEEVPGEGSCFMDGVTYPNNSEVPPLNPCHTQCTCVSSIIHCLSLKCPSPPEDVSHCTTVHDEKSCCPTYICDETSTSPVEGHEATTVSEDEHTETPLTSEDEEGQHTPVKAVTQQSADKPSEGKPDDEEHGVTEEPKPDGMIPGPAGIEVPDEDEHTPTKVTDGHTPERPEETTHAKPSRPQRPQSGYFPSSDLHHPSTALPSYFGTGKPITTVEEHTEHQRPDSDDQVLGTDEPMTEDKKPGHEEQPMTTADHKPHDEMGEPESPTKVTGEMPDGQKPSEHHEPTTSEDHPSTGQHLPETGKPHTTTDEESSMMPHQPTKHKPSEGHESTPTGQETGDHTTHRPEDGVEPSEDHKQPSVHPTAMDNESALTTTSPHERPQTGVTGVEDTHGEPSPDHSMTTDMPESGQVTSKVPMTHDTVGTLPEDEKDQKHTPTTDRPEEQGHTHTPVDQFGQPEDDSTHPSTEHPTDHATSEDQDHKKPEGVTSEDDHSTMSPDDKFVTGQPMVPSGVFTDSHTKPEADVPQEHGMTERPHGHTEPHEGSEAPHTKPEDSVDEDSTHTTARPHGQPSEETEGKPETSHPSSMDSESEPTSVGPHGKPTVEDTHKPQPGEHPSEDGVHTTGRPQEEVFEGQEPHMKPEVDSHTSTDEETGHFTTTRPHGHPSDAEEPHKRPHPSTMDEESGQTTTSPQGQPTGDAEEPHKRPHPSTMDEESGHTTTRPHGQPSDAEEPHKRPHPSTMDEESAQTTVRPHGHPSDVEEPHKRPEESKPEDDVMESGTKRPMEPGTSDESGQEESQTDEYHPGVSHPTTEGVMVDGQPEHVFASTLRPKPGQSTPSHVSHKPKPEEIPEEVLLHPTRTPGTFQTERPDMEPDHETTDHQLGPMVDEAISTVFPEGFFRPVTKRPTIGSDKPDVMTHRPQTDGPEGTGKPTHDLTTELPDNLAEIFGTIRPMPSHTQHGQRPDFGDFLPGTGIFQKPDFMKPDEDLGEHDLSEETTPHEEYPSQYTTAIPGLKPGPWKRPIYSTNGTHFVQYVPVKEGEAPKVPQGAMLGEPEEGPDGDKYWPIIFVKPAASTTEPTTETQKPTPQQVFNGTHFIQYVPFEDGEKPKVPEGATLGHPVKKPDGQLYWPVVDTKPLPTTLDEEPTTQEPFPGQIYNGTHFIQYLPYDEDQPEVPEGATLGEPQTGPNGEKYWPIVSTKPLPDEEGTTTGSVEPQPEQIFNGTHFIQYVPFKDGEAPEVPEEATLGQPQKGPDGQIYWPIINTKPIPVTPSEDVPTTHVPPVQVFNGTNFIQYVPFKDGEAPEVPEGATLGQPQKTPDGEIYWPIIYAKPQPVKPDESLPSQVFNGTHYIQYVPYEEDKKPEVPEGATLGQPQKTPDGQTFWPLIYSKPVTTKPEDEPTTTEEPFKTQHFNGSHFIQYIPFTEGYEPQLPEEATMGEPVTQPDGQKYWPIIYEKLPTTAKPEEIQPHLGQVYNGTHFIQYVPYRPNHKPQVPEEATVGEPVKGPDGQTYWPIVSTKPLPHLEEEPVKPQVFNGTHYTQYVPYEEEKPEVPEGAVLGEPETQPDGQKYWPIISKTPFPGLPVTTEQEPEPSTTEPTNKQVFNGTHYTQYVPYKPGKRPVIPEGATLGKPTKGPNDEMYWPIIHQTPVPGLPVTTQFDDAVPTTEPVFNGTHYIQYAPYKPGQRPVTPEGATLGKPTKGPDDQMYWPIVHQTPVPGLPTTTLVPFDDYESTTEPVNVQFHNGTHYIQYVPYKPGKRPLIPEDATLGQPVRRPDNQLYWPIIRQKPVEGLPITTQQGPVEDELTTTEPVTEQVFNGTHYIQYVPYKPGQRPVVPEEATLGKPVRRPDNQLYWPIIRQKPVEGLPITTQQGPADDVLSTTEPVTEQYFNGTHYTQYVPYKPGQRPVIPDDATLGKPTRRPDNQLYWPIIRQKPVEGLPITTQQGPAEDDLPTTEPVTEQVFNGTHYIQYVPYKPGQRPLIPDEATLGNPTKGPNNQLYWPIVYQTPVPDLPITTQTGQYEDVATTTEPVTEQVFNGTHYIQYVPYKPGQRPVIPEEATLGNPTKGPNNQLYWPIVYLTPVPDLPITTQTGQYEDADTTTESVTLQAHNGTHLLQYVPYKPGQQPEVPEGAFLGKPTKGPDGETYWPVIYQTPIPGTTTGQDDTETTKKPFTGQVFNGTHYIQYVPYEPEQRPVIPEDAVLGKPTKGPNGQMYYPVIKTTPFSGVPITTETDIFDETTTEPVTIQVYNGTHYIHYVPYKPGQRPTVPEDATLGKPTKGPNDEMYWPVIYTTIPSYVTFTTEEPFEGTTLSDPTEGQVYNGTHYIQYVPYKPGKRPTVPEGATLGKPTKGPSDQMYWPVIHLKPVPGVPIVDRAPTFDPSKGQVFNGTHYIQYVPYKPLHRPVIPTEAKLGKPTLGPNGQMYWPIIHPKPVPGLPIVTETPLAESNPEKGQHFNGTHYIQYVPYTPGHRPVVPEGAVLGQPETKSDGQKYWPIIRSRPAPGVPINWMPYGTTTPRPEQIFNGTHYIQYLPYNPMQMPEVPEGATLGHPQKGPEGQMYWVLISDKPIPVHTFNGTHVVQYVTPVTPEHDSTHDGHKPLQVFNGTHYIQYVPYTPGQQPVVPEGAVLGKPTKGPEGQTYWPIIYKKRPVGDVPSTTATPQDGQIFNGTHFIRYVPYNPSKRPNVPEGATISKPETRPDGHKYWVIASKKPLPVLEDEPVTVPPGQIYNGTHYIQYVPYNPSQMPKVPEGAVLGHPQMGPDGHMNWVIISDKPLPAQPGTQYVQYVTPVTPEENKFTQGLIHNGTHYIQYVPYKPAQIPHIPNDATLGDLEQGPGGQMYWPIIFKKPPQGPIFNGTHYVTYAPHNASNSTKDHPFWDYGQYGTKGKPTTESYPVWSKPGQNVTKHPTQESSKPSYGERPGGEDSFESIDEDHLIEYPSGSDYDETQEQPYGPGTCRYAGKVYVSAQQIPRDDPCDFCFCFRSDIICLQQSCPPPIPGCHEEPIQGFCCPRYECHVRMATLLNVTSTTTTTTTTLPPHFLSHVYNGAAGRTGCFVQGKAYRVGQAIASASGPCMDCICGGDGKMKCEPKVCTPEPMVRQMMVSTEKATTANHR